MNSDDTPALVELAGLPCDSLLSEAGPLLDRALSQLGVDIPPWCFAWEGLDPDDYHTLSDAESEAVARTLAKQWVAR